MVYGLRELKNMSRDNCEWVKNGDFFLLFDAIIAHRCATMRYDSASPKTGAWPSLVHILLDSLPSRAFHLVDEDTNANDDKDEKKGEHTNSREDESFSLFA